jgi:argininosuccinate lyase
MASVSGSLDMLSKLIPSLKVNEKASNKLLLSFSTATELANMLVRKYKVPFRTAHKIVGSLVRALTETKSTLSDVTPESLQKVAQESTGLKLKVDAKDIRESADLLKLVETYKVRGGPSPVEVERMLKIRKKCVVQSRSNLSEKKLELDKAEEKLQTVVKAYLSSNKPSIKFKSSSG